MKTSSLKSSYFYQVWVRLKRNKLAMAGLIVFIAILLVAIFAPVLAPDGYDFQQYEIALQGPSKEHPFGTDNYGRDLLDRVIWGSRVSLSVGLYTIFFSGLIGTVLGLFAAYYKKADSPIMRTLDVVMSIPTTLLAISVVAMLGPGMRNMLVAMIVAYVPPFARVVRASALTIIEQEYIEASTSIGASDFRIIFYHILPNSIAPLIVQCSLDMASSILLASTLSYFGVGIPLPTPEWGAMLSIGRTYLRSHAYMTIFPGLAILLTAFSLNVLGDGLRDALDPRLKN